MQQTLDIAKNKFPDANYSLNKIIERLADITSIYRRYGSFKDATKKNEIYGNGIGMIIGDNFQDIKEKLRELLQ
jgi:hypothetical protein